MHKDRSFVFGIAYYIVVSLAIIIFSSPLFRVLGFEYAGLVSLFASAHLLYYVAERTSFGNKGDILAAIRNVVYPVFFFSTIPLIVSLLSSIFIPNCDLFYGLLMYVEIVYPTALIALLFGVHFGIISKTASRRRWYVAAFWLITFFISLLPGYINPQIFTYGWQYGFFPGFVWDAAMSLKLPYWLSRAIVLLFGITILFYDKALCKVIDKKKRIKVREIYTLLFLLLIGLIFPTLGRLGIAPTHSLVENLLLTSKMTEGNITLHYMKDSFTNDEEILLRYNVSRYAQEIHTLYEITYSKKIDVYIYPSEDAYDKYIGTRSASITKPWLAEVHIARDNLGSLKHELVHTILSDHGSFPFDISWSTGLTEGSAVAAEDEYDGIRNCDEYAARILQMNLAHGVKDIMSFSGFASNASGKSYVLAGSFCKYLIHQFGGEKFLQLYGSRDYEKLYGKTLSLLEAEWVKSLVVYQTPIDDYDSLRVRFYFDRLSIINEPCLRRIGRMTQEAEEMYRARKYADADSIYELVLRESDRLDAIRGRVYCQLQLHSPRAALAILDTTKTAISIHNGPALHLLRGDVIAMATDDMQTAQAQWNEALGMELSDRSFLAAYARLNCLAHGKEVDKVQEYLKSIYSDTSSLAFENRTTMLQGLSSIDEADSSFSDCRNYLLAIEYSSKGKLRESLQYLTKVLEHRKDDLFYTLISKKVEQLNAALVPITLR